MSQDQGRWLRSPLSSQFSAQLDRPTAWWAVRDAQLLWQLRGSAHVCLISSWACIWTLGMARRGRRQASGSSSSEGPASLGELCKFLCYPSPLADDVVEEALGLPGPIWGSFVLFSVSYFAAGRLLASGNTGSNKRWRLLAFWADVFLSLCIRVAERCKEVFVTQSDIRCCLCFWEHFALKASETIPLLTTDSLHVVFFLHPLFVGEFCFSYSTRRVICLELSL